MVAASGEGQSTLERGLHNGSMELRVDRLRLERFEAVVFDRGADRWAIVMPGAGYSVQAPLLWYARRAALEAGRNVLAVADVFDRDRDEPTEWVEERCEATVRHVRSHDAHPLVITKSLTSLAARFAADEALPSVWLTPLIADRGTTVASQVIEGLRAGTAPRLLIGGSDDPTWDDGIASGLSHAQILELRGADHSLEVPGDVARSLGYLRKVTEAIRAFAADLG